ncbi:MAG: alpha-N-arabinofuranosidase [Chitinophagaceae bacterium]|nr:alpha-N-arabinofuranosidase [Chitinophagaceae bacterium]
MKKLNCLLLLFCCVHLAQAQNKVVLTKSSTTHLINRNIYGHFAEHLGRCIYGGFYVGEGNKKIPNKNGIRTDVVEAMKKLKIPNLRWPGGCFADTYHWKDGVGPKTQRPTIVNAWWGGVTEDNSFGTNEFLNMCEMLGAEPYLAANIGTGTPQELIDWVQYVSFSGVSPMSKLRKQNGRSKPWNVKFWGVGNEAWGCGGNMRPEYYADKYRESSTFMSGWSNDKKIYRIAAGANSGDLNWTETLMKTIPLNMMEGIGLHHYAVIDWNKKGSATDYNEEQYFTTMKRALYMDELITKNEAILDKYDPKKKVGLIVDEWGGWYNVEPGTNPGFLYQQNTMRDAVLAASTLNIFNNHSERVRMANLAQAINVLQSVILTQQQKMILTPTYHVMEMYTVHQDATFIPLNVKSEDYELGNEKLPAISASASIDSIGNVHITLANIDMNKEQEVSIDVSDYKLTNVKGRVLTSAKVQDHNSFENPNKIKPAMYNGASLSGNSLSVKIPPFSVVVLQLK